MSAIVILSSSDASLNILNLPSIAAKLIPADWKLASAFAVDTVSAKSVPSATVIAEPEPTVIVKFVAAPNVGLDTVPCAT